MLSYNLPDPTEQERVRRGSHEYRSDGGVHGRYMPKPYVHQEYPKIMDKTPFPQLKDFAGKHDAEILLEHARKMWDTKQMASQVNNVREEKEWLAAHADDPVLTPGAYPKTMDRTSPPRADDCNGVEDYRQKRQAWRDQIANSIVHDEVEERLWIEEHTAASNVVVEAPKRRRGRKPKVTAEVVA